MTLFLEDKKAIVAKVSEVASDSVSLVVADYRGLSVPKLTELRKKARESNVHLQVVRNTLAKRALKGTSFECIESKLTGPLIFGFARNEPSAAARLFRDFAKNNEALKVHALSIGGESYEASQLDRVASLPTRMEALSQLAGTLMAPINQLARVIKEPTQMLARALDDYARKGE